MWLGEGFRIALRFANLRNFETGALAPEFRLDVQTDPCRWIPATDLIFFDEVRLTVLRRVAGNRFMAKTQRKLKKANHGRRPASAKARRAKRKHVRLS